MSRSIPICYRLLPTIGEGGMGSVWMAEQEKPVRRMVALKIIKAGMDSSHDLFFLAQGSSSTINHGSKLSLPRNCWREKLSVRWTS